ncbi:MAG TPA: hypothetical protein VFQ44_30165 [Streptosporangiaceae bacterium]|nr:hypothetical protein [Streptosporangiaceae bacterium]
MDLTSDNLVEALTVVSGQAAASPMEIADLVRQVQPGFAPTIFSAWKAEGRTLNPAMAYEVDYARKKVDYYRSVAATVKSAVPALSTIKGLEVAALYPDHLIRLQSDLDFIAPSQADLWQAVSLLTDDGWKMFTATFLQLEGDLHVMVSLERDPGDEYRPALHLELTTYFTSGNQGGIPHIMRLPDEWLAPGIKNTVMLLHERYEQPFRARDLIDAVLLTDSLNDAQVGELHKAVIALGLVVAYDELVKLVAKTSLPPLRPLPGGLLTVARGRARRVTRGASYFSNPVGGTGRTLQRRSMQGKLSRAEGLAWEALQRQLSVTAGVGQGMLAFGLPINGPRPDVTDAVLRRKGKLVWADTPAGRFLLTLGDYVTQAGIDELSGNGQSRAGAEATGAGRAAESAETSR